MSQMVNKARRTNDRPLSPPTVRSQPQRKYIKNPAPVIRGCLFLNRRMKSNRPNSLGKTERLKSRKQIEALFKTGKKITHAPFRLLYRFEKVQGEIKAGFTVSSKNFPRAVDRNRIKRLCRECYRVQSKELKTMFSDNHRQVFLFFIYTDRDIRTYDSIHRSVKLILEKLVGIAHEENTENS